MRPRWLVLAVAVGWLGPVAAARALDFRLSPVVFSEDGFTRQRMAFRYDQGTRMMVDLPRDWSVTAEPAALALISNANADMIRIEKSPLTPATAFQDKELDVYRRRFLSSLPEGAMNVQIIQERANPLPVYHWTDYEFVAAYDFYGRSIRRGAIFIDLNAKDQILMTVVADHTRFEQCHNTGFDVLRSWTPVSGTSD